MHFCLLRATVQKQKVYSVFSSHDAKQKSVSAEDVWKMRRPLPAMLSLTPTRCDMKFCCLPVEKPIEEIRFRRLSIRLGA